MAEKKCREGEILEDGSICSNYDSNSAANSNVNQDLNSANPAFLMNRQQMSGGEGDTTTSKDPAKNQQQDKDENLNLPQIESIFFMNFSQFSKLVLSAALKNTFGKYADFQNLKGSSSSSSSSTTSSSFSSSAALSLLSSPASSSSIPSPPSPSLPLPSSTPPAGSSSSNPEKNDNQKDKGWNEVCLGLWKKSPNVAYKDFRGHCIGISIVRASSQKELDELNERPVTGIRVSIVSEEMEQDRKKDPAKEALKQKRPDNIVAKTAPGKENEPLVPLPPWHFPTMKEMQTMVEKQVAFTKKFAEKLATGEVIMKALFSMQNSFEKRLREWIEKWNKGNN